MWKLLLLCSFCHFNAHRAVFAVELQPDMSNVCPQHELAMVSHRQPCVQAFTRMVKVWKQGCLAQRWCMGYERRTAYYTAYRQVYSMEYHVVYKCCPGWMQQEGQPGCLHRVCLQGACFNGGKCAEGGSLICQCPVGFQGSHCQYVKLLEDYFYLSLLLLHLINSPTTCKAGIAHLDADISSSIAKISASKSVGIQS
ncbi:multiple epidermal growth factor-like domains protein 6 [Protopterus annectens]|uniref:multiple epidermal growth factor-like domains protein 6 n=1 Tax=Protopterus annectens TaxID=7888 RepID=UPI001CFA1848|nr:multiple epidermal growth factor-like domains protein 6 [Protopterus annectens]